MSDEGLVGFLVVSFVWAGIQIFISWFLWDGLRRIPSEHRTVEPFFAWLMLIPIVGFIFWWILLPFKIPESLGRYYHVKAKNDYYHIEALGPDKSFDYGKMHGLWVMIPSTLLIVPGLNYFAWIPALVFLILYLVKFGEYKKGLPENHSDASVAAHPRSNIANGEKYDSLAKIKKLLDDGVLSQEEFDAEKRKLLDTK